MHKINEEILAIIKAIPAGKVAGYGQIAAYVGLANGARTVARLLHSCSEKHDLPWWRVLHSSGEIALPLDGGGGLQKELLLTEGVTFCSPCKVDMAGCAWILND